MILTVTMNPSMDMSFSVAEFYRGGVFRATDSQQTAGGKGLNVTRVLSLLGAPVVATGLLGGSNGAFIRQELDAAGIEHSFVPIMGNTRACIAVLDDGQTEVLGRGPDIQPQELEEFYRVFAELASVARIICMSGSLPPSLPKDAYRSLIEIAHRSDCQVLLDTSGPALARGLEAAPHLVKPNQHELQALTGGKLEDEASLVKAIHAMTGSGVETVVVSRGREGALALSQGRLYRVQVPEVQAVNPVGSGDAMVAGLAWGLHEGWDLEQTLALAAACGVSNALEKQTGSIDPGAVHEIVKRVEVTRV